jgi:hypothetical protein
VSYYYKLDKDHRAVPVRDVIEWATWFETADRIVTHTRFEPGILVSTVFLGLDHRFGDRGPPLLFETMVFGINMEDEAMTCRYSTWDDAETGHKATVRRVKELLVKASMVTIRESGPQ